MGALILLSVQVLGDKIDEICAKWSRNDGNSDSPNDDIFQVGDESYDACLLGWASAADNPETITRYIPDGITCYGYYVCESESAIGIWNKCGMGTHFNPLWGKCASPGLYRCPHNRCSNVYASNMAVLDSGCKEYYECSSGRKGSCPVSRPYFEEMNQECSDVKPTYSICH